MTHISCDDDDDGDDSGGGGGGGSGGGGGVCVFVYKKIVLYDCIIRI